MTKFPISLKGFDKLKEEIKELEHTERPKIIEAIATARDYGDLSENAEYHAAREKQSFIEGRIIDLEDKVARAEIIDTSKLSGDTVTFGATVKLLDVDSENEDIVTYHIVGEYEADISRKRVSIVSPIAKALIGKKVRDEVEVVTPKNSKTYEILEILFQDLDI